jgi:predicted transcriptional regulator
MRTSAGHHTAAEWRITLSLSNDLRDPLAELAKQNERSANLEIRIARRKHVERAERDTDGQET